MALVTVASDRAIQGADDAIAHILPEPRLRKVMSGKQTCNCLLEVVLVSLSIPYISKHQFLVDHIW